MVTVKGPKYKLGHRVWERHPDLKYGQVYDIVDTVFNELAEMIRESPRLQIDHFGVWHNRIKPPHMGRNPRNQEQVEVPERREINFRAAKKLRRL